MYAKKLTLFFVLFLFLISPSLAFAETQDSSSSPLIQTIGIGVSNTNISETYDLEVLVNTEGHRRVKGELDNVVVSPGDRVDIFYFYKALEDIFLEEVRLTLSRNTESLGNITNILEIDDVRSDQIHTLWGNVDLYKEGVGKYFTLNQNLLAGEESKLLLSSYQVIQPVQILSWDIIPNLQMQEVNLSVVVKNFTDEYLNNVQYEHCGYVLERDFLPSEEYTYTYEISRAFSEGKDISLGEIHISDPNTKKECAVYGSSYYQYFLTDAIPVYAYFNGSWFSGAYVQPEGGSFCAQRLPYSFTSEDIKYVAEEAVDNDVDNNVQEVEKDSEEDILGVQQSILDNIKELPKTYSSNINIIILLLVVDIYLWYAFFNKRRHYESKNKDTRICTKSSKDVRKGRF